MPTLLTWPGQPSSTTSRARTGTLTAGLALAFLALSCCSIRPTAQSRGLQSAARGAHAATAEVRDVQNIADILVDPEGALERRNHWEKTSHSLLVGAILHVLYAEADKTLAGVAEILSDPERPIEKTLRS